MSETLSSLSPPAAETSKPFLSRVRVRNYKSIRNCDLTLRPLTVLVGPNGSGKSNLLDAVAFVADALRGSLDTALQARGGIDGIIRRIPFRHHKLDIQLALNLSEDTRLDYWLTLTTRHARNLRLDREDLSLTDSRGECVVGFKRREQSVAAHPHQAMPPVSRGHLYLSVAAALPEYRLAYDALGAMGFYNFHPEAMRAPQAPGQQERLLKDGRNIASVFKRISENEPDRKARIEESMQTILPGLSSVRTDRAGPWEAVVFRHALGKENEVEFYPVNLSDGTLHAFGALLAVSQSAEQEAGLRLVGIEEPETSLHPGAIAIVMEAIREASGHTQTILTTHSPDLLDHVDPETDALFSVIAESGTTLIAPVNSASLSTIRGIWTELLAGEYIEVLTPIRQHRSKLVRRGQVQEYELGKSINLAARRLSASPSSTDPAMILLLLDADEDAACRLAPELLRCASNHAQGLTVACVLANPEYETWFVAAIESLQEQLELPEQAPDAPEAARLGKGWIDRHFRRTLGEHQPPHPAGRGRHYRETSDQPKLTARMDLSLCRSRSPSFDKLCRELDRYLQRPGASTD